MTSWFDTGSCTKPIFLYMEKITLNTPALLFPAITLLMLAYTNRFLALASLIRSLRTKYNQVENKEVILQQIRNLRTRLNLIRYMQGMGVISFFLCVLCMYTIFRGWDDAAHYIFVASLLSLLLSLVFSLLEIQRSTKALELELGDIMDAK
jgi:Protein of unknown function (DUF2721)